MDYSSSVKHVHLFLCTTCCGNCCLTYFLFLTGITGC